MLDQADGDAPLAHRLAQERVEALARGGIEAGGRFIEEPDPRLRHRDAGQRQELPLGIAQSAGLCRGERGKPGCGEHRFHPRLAGGPAPPSAPLPEPGGRLQRGAQIVDHPHPFEEAEILETPRDPGPGDAIGGKPGDLPCCEPDLAAIRAEMAGDEVEERGLSRPVGTHQRGEHARLQIEIDPIHCRDAAETARKATHAEQRAHPPPSLRPKSPAGRKIMSSVMARP